MRAIAAQRRKTGGFRRFLRAPVLSVACVIASAIAAPTMVSAFASHSESPLVSLSARGALGSFTPASVDSRLAGQASLQALAHGHLFRFTPAGLDSRTDRSVTVAVRVIDVHGRLIAARTPQADANPGLASVRIAPIAYNLGLARGYQSFALPAAPVVHDMPRDNAELRTFSIASRGDTVATTTSRFAPDITLAESAAPGRTPRTLGTQGDYQVRMGGSYRLMRNIDVTAGLRDSSDRERLRALTDHRQDSQAIYVGTQIHF